MMSLKKYNEIKTPLHSVHSP